MKKVGKILGWVGGGMGVLLVIIWTGFFVWGRLGEAREERSVAVALTAHKTEEIVVGETPEETFALFLDALREEDLALAANYFSPELRAGWRLHLARIREEGLLDTMIADLENAEEDAPLSEEHFHPINGQWYLAFLQ